MITKETFAFRLNSLDGLRGLAILMMIFSGTIPFNDALPAWMYHAQLPPPDHKFLPDLPGITWVDLVFPFFLFSMGTAIPFSIGSKIANGMSISRTIFGLTGRFIGLALFAIVSQNSRPWIMASESWVKWAASLVAFLGMFLMFASPASGWWKRQRIIIGVLGVVILIGLFVFLDQFGIVAFKFKRFDIIIMVLANTALVGGLIYILFLKFKHTLLISFGVMIAFFISARDGASWVTEIFYWSPAPWLISWNYLKYLIILIPGIYTGHIIRSFILEPPVSLAEDIQSSKWSISIVASSLLIILVAVIGLYLRYVALSLVLTLIGAGVLIVSVKKFNNPWKKPLDLLLPLAITLIMVGYLVEPIHGGIKKDSATLSYLVLTGGLALLALFILIILIDVLKVKFGTGLITGAGKNAMLAYIAGSNLIMPIMALTGIDYGFNISSFYEISQTVRAIIITLLVALVSGFIAGKRIFMKV